jgi:ribosome-associated protein
MAKSSKNPTERKGTSVKNASPATRKTVKKVAVKKVAVKKVAKATSPVKKTTAKAKVIKAKVVKAKIVKAKVNVKNEGSTLKSNAVKALPEKAKKSPVKLKILKSQAELLADAAIQGILEKKGKNIICMNLQKVPNAVCDFFIICEAESTRQVSAIADSVDFEVKKATGENPFHTEGWENSLWILLDYVNVVVHVFERETRHFYRLESLWADAEVKEFGVEYA